jgi:hypothetical protein
MQGLEALPSSGEQAISIAIAVVAFLLFCQKIYEGH